MLGHRSDVFVSPESKLKDSPCIKPAIIVSPKKSLLNILHFLSDSDSLGMSALSERKNLLTLVTLPQDLVLSRLVRSQGKLHFLCERKRDLGKPRRYRSVQGTNVSRRLVQKSATIGKRFTEGDQDHSD